LVIVVLKLNFILFSLPFFVSEIDSNVFQTIQQLMDQFSPPVFDFHSKTAKYKVSNSLIPLVPTIPTSVTFVKIPENQVVEDLTTYRTIPYLGDDIRLELNELHRISSDLMDREHEVSGEAEELLIAYFIDQATFPLSSPSVPKSPDVPASVNDVTVLPEILGFLAISLQLTKKEILKSHKIISEGSWYRGHL
jgi:hypothetical protein